MTVRREMAEWRTTSARSATRVTCEPFPCLSRFSRQSRPSGLSQGTAIAVEARTNNAGLGSEDRYIHLPPGHPARIMQDRATNPVWHEPTQYGRVTVAYQPSSARELIHDAQSDHRRRRCCTCSSCRGLCPAPSSDDTSIDAPHPGLLSCTFRAGDSDPPWLAPQ